MRLFANQTEVVSPAVALTKFATLPWHFEVIAAAEREGRGVEVTYYDTPKARVVAQMQAGQRGIYAMTPELDRYIKHLRSYPPATPYELHHLIGVAEHIDGTLRTTIEIHYGHPVICIRDYAFYSFKDAQRYLQRTNEAEFCGQSSEQAA